MLNETQMNSFLRKHDVTKFYLFAGDYPLYNQTFSVYCETYPPPTGDRPVHIPGDKADYWSDAAAYHIQWILTDPSRKKGDYLLVDVLSCRCRCCRHFYQLRGTEQLIVFLYLKFTSAIYFQNRPCLRHSQYKTVNSFFQKYSIRILLCSAMIII